VQPVCLILRRWYSLIQSVARQPPLLSINPLRVLLSLSGKWLRLAGLNFYCADHRNFTRCSISFDHSRWILIDRVLTFQWKNGVNVLGVLFRRPGKAENWFASPQIQRSEHHWPWRIEIGPARVMNLDDGVVWQHSIQNFKIARERYIALHEFIARCESAHHSSERPRIVNLKCQPRNGGQQKNPSS
jgi:hypothetical protein